MMTSQPIITTSLLSITFYQHILSITLYQHILSINFEYPFHQVRCDTLHLQWQHQVTATANAERVADMVEKKAATAVAATAAKENTNANSM